MDSSPPWPMSHQDKFRDLGPLRLLETLIVPTWFQPHLGGLLSQVYCLHSGQHLPSAGLCLHKSSSVRRWSCGGSGPTVVLGACSPQCLTPPHARAADCCDTLQCTIRYAGPGGSALNLIYDPSMCVCRFFLHIRCIRMDIDNSRGYLKPRQTQPTISM
jgi:hypothetical protein